MEGERQRQRENVSMSPSTASVWLSGLFLFLPTFVSLVHCVHFSAVTASFFFFLRGYSVMDSHKLWSLEEVTLA